jgi:hypothetical protein
MRTRDLPHMYTCHWLQSVDISNLADFAEALDDDEFVRLEMKGNGLKYFKRFVLKKAIIDETNCGMMEPSKAPLTNDRHLDVADGVGVRDAPNELICPILHVLMVQDPVLARDGYCYEREAIESWFERVASQGTERVLSPMNGEPLTDLTLVPSASILSLARDFARAHPNAL